MTYITLYNLIINVKFKIMSNWFDIEHEHVSLMYLPKQNINLIYFLSYIGLYIILLLDYY